MSSDASKHAGISPVEDRLLSIRDQAARAASNGDWSLSSRLLERALRLARFNDPQLNSLWMVSAKRACTGPEAIARALEFAQHAWLCGSGGASLEFLQFVMMSRSRSAAQTALCEQKSREWPSLLAAGSKTEVSLRPRPRGGPSLRIGHLVGYLNPTHAPSRLIHTLVSETSGGAAENFVYSSEWTAGWFLNWNRRTQSGPEDFLATLTPAKIHLHEATGGFLHRSRRLAQKILQDELDVLVVHASNIELITALAACMKPAPWLINVNHASEMSFPCFDGVVHMFANGVKRTLMPQVPAEVIPPASDMGKRFDAAKKVTKQELGIPCDATVSGTFGNLYKINNTTYLSALRGILERNPLHHHMVAGGGDDDVIRDYVRNLALQDRVHILGRRMDIPALLGVLDFYIASFPYPGAVSEIEAMSAACPVISMRAPEDSHYNSGAEVVGLEDCLVDEGDVAAVVALATRFVNDRNYAWEVGGLLRERYIGNFLPDRIARRHLAFYRSVCEQKVAMLR